MGKKPLITALLFILVISLVIIGCTGKKKGFKDGTYKGEGEGKGGKMVVEVKVSKGKIDNIKVLEQNETPGYFEPARDGIVDQVKSKNSTSNIQAVSGATLTSKGMIAAIEDALKKAK